jgi:glycosyltransferase involved in cell wall biosynthesis
MTGPGLAVDAPAVSVILPTFNRASTLHRACESVLAQQPGVHELIVVDDGSTDDTERIMTELARRDPRLKYVKQDNAGACAARNHGIDLARGDLIAFQDSDDEWLPGKLAAQLKARAGKPALVFTAHIVEMLDGSEEVRPTVGLPKLPDLLAHNYISTQTVLVDRSVLGEVRFDPRLRRLQDWDVWLSLMASRRVRFTFVTDPLVRLYRQTDSLSNSQEAYFDSLRILLFKHWRLYRAHPLRWIRHLARVVRFKTTGAT